MVSSTDQKQVLQSRGHCIHIKAFMLMAARRQINVYATCSVFAIGMVSCCVTVWRPVARKNEAGTHACRANRCPR